MTINNELVESVLIPIDGSAGSMAAVVEVVRRARRLGRIEAHLVNVQLPEIAAEIRAHRPPETSETHYARSGAEALSRAQAMLKDAGIACTVRQLVGPVVQTLLEQCEDLQCDSIVMGTHGRAALLGGLMGSVATGIVHLAKVPVTLVKALQPTANAIG
jgi:nucleotide-binding universal stress UspA family protein